MHSGDASHTLYSGSDGKVRATLCTMGVQSGVSHTALWQCFPLASHTLHYGGACLGRATLCSACHTLHPCCACQVRVTLCVLALLGRCRGISRCVPRRAASLGRSNLINLRISYTGLCSSTNTPRSTYHPSLESSNTRIEWFDS